MCHLVCPKAALERLHNMALHFQHLRSAVTIGPEEGCKLRVNQSHSHWLSLLK